ncbi:MAG: hypothetical protein N838_31685 [Thiohalocapsa sp. PB-PSB1]|nr:MAG: hypothetical protein N838_31685 [Thiohalocapsa sp. PB-PSB1]
METVLIEILVSSHMTGAALMTAAIERLPEVQIDRDYQPVEITPRPDDAARVAIGEKVIVIRGRIASDQRDVAESRPGVLNIWTDTKVAPFGLD